jgi:hypothetical protein
MPTRRVFLGQLVSPAVAARAAPVAQTTPPLEIGVSGDGLWQTYRRFDVPIA